MTIGVAAVAYGETYRAFLPRWARAITALERKPDKVIVVTDDVPSCLEQLGDSRLHNITFLQARGTYIHHPQVLVNEGIVRLDTDWVCKMDIDDIIFRHAFNDLPVDADVYMFGIQLNEKWLPARHVTRGDIMRSDYNLVFSGSPFRKWVWEKSPYKDMICEDWAFWLDAAKNAARFVASPNIDYEYVLHGDNITLRSDMATAENRVRGMR